MKKRTLQKSRAVIALILLALIALSVCSCGSNGSISSGSFTGNFREDGSIIIDGEIYQEIESFPYDFQNSFLNRGWIGEKGQKKPQDADTNAEMVNGVLVL